ncbi:hypothetical protein POKO110462_09065 [Pontibacter korlensis]|uniref:Outer membrane protein beta-barrel domain-containing protein n=1 Tax=Pontibacter korlensis TaxID=400092 RepID=A0A0E3ZE34_9BACT|nr:hypothetical protein [Pontibacter korlensis]AKD02640.1 hypothetical protein PKOR_05265 [Pontibacter korlensis]
MGVNLSGGTSAGLKLRKFTSESTALRYGVYTSYDHSKLSGDARHSNLLVSFAPGFEKHFAGTKRFSPYLGLTMPLSVRGARYKSDLVVVKGSTSESYLDNNNRSYFGVRLNGLAGVDFYIAKNFYVGFEAGVGIGYRKYSDVEVEYKQEFTSNRTVEGYHGFNFGTFTTGGLRIGFVF